MDAWLVEYSNKMFRPPPNANHCCCMAFSLHYRYTPEPVGTARVGRLQTAKSAFTSLDSVTLYKLVFYAKKKQQTTVDTMFGALDRPMLCVIRLK